MKVLVTGAAGFIGGYLVAELLSAGYEVIGLDNLSKYGPRRLPAERHPRFHFVNGDAKDRRLVSELLSSCAHFVAGAAMVGGIAYIHQRPFDLLVENERIAATALEAGIEAHHRDELRKITLISSSMVYENATVFPTTEGEQLRCPPPSSSYGFQKLSVEYFARAAFEQHGLPFTVVRPFNCVGIGDQSAQGDSEITSGDLRLALSHVVPDLIHKVLRGQDPLHILGDGRQVRHFTSGVDVARGIRRCMEDAAATNEDFNISTAQPTSILEVAEMIWRRIHGADRPFRYVCDSPYPHDVQHRSPSVSKAEQLLGFRAKTPLHDMLDEVISWIRRQIEQGTI